KRTSQKSGEASDRVLANTAARSLYLTKQSEDCLYMARASKRHRLIKIDWPEFGVAACAPPSSLSEFEARIAALRARMEERKLTHTIVYADREHFANLAYLTGFDPRFEEALLLLMPEGSPTLLVGNEDMAYTAI